MEVDFDAKTAIVSTASDKVDRAACEAALKEAGYGIATFEDMPAK